MEKKVIDAESLIKSVYSKSIDDIKNYLNMDSTRSIERWRSLSAIPIDINLDMLNKLTGIEIPKPLILREVLLKINLSKDSYVSSNGKKVFNLLMLCDDECLDCSNGAAHKYLIDICKKALNLEDDVDNNVTKKLATKKFKYIACRVVDLNMLVDVGMIVNQKVSHALI